MAQPVSASKIDDTLTARYEELRSQVLGGLGHGIGLALFLRQGTRSWIEAWRQGTLAAPREHNQSEPAQGGVISPLMANIYLHVLDMYWTKQ
jgi:hypothetical protein